MGSAELAVEHLEATGVQLEDWRQVLRLAKTHSATLGFLPDSAFADRLRKRTLIAAKADGQVIGYCLYDLPRAGHIKLVHVCVADDARGFGAGKAMIDAAIAQNPTAIGVLAYCRRDYQGLDRFWESAGLAPRGEKAGRAVAGSILCAWWRPLGAPDLLEEAAMGAGLPLVAYDTNVVSDLYASPSVIRPDRESSLGLLAGWLQAAIVPVVSPRVDVELNAISDRSERELQRERSQELMRIRSTRADDNTLLEQLLEKVGDSALANDESLRNDFCHLVDAITAGASFVVTNDENFIDAANSALPEDTGARVVRPHELVATMLERLELPTFRSRLIESLDLEWRPASAWPVTELAAKFATHETHERTTALARRLRAAIAQHPTTTRVLSDPSSRPLALVAEVRSDPALQVSLLRVSRGESSTTIALQLARHLRTVARQNNLTTVEVTDAQRGPVIQAALAQDGYVGSDLPRATLINDLAGAESYELPEVYGQPDLRAVRELERRFWPMVIIDLAVPTYVIPVQPGFAELLFGIDRGALWSDRKRGLGLSREHVYYSGSSRPLPEEGSRILWYVTSDRSGTIRKVMAHSRTLGVARLPAEAAHRANAHVGVFTLRHIEGAADRTGMVTVVRFEDTELLEHPVGGRELEELMMRHDVKHPLMSIRRVDPQFFDSVLRRQNFGAP
ncbi:GNAT family N-acetyltransferase [Microbacterium sp. QXD-8]|uniref:GNAT family N-acetyltransferase n=1 Tax=Microbacterium psychrotolerans TaxID=3068321 RepID=A0ABU0YW76_9MICO|nr:GNAT family N-acetyltransferase [Microbacterium sp. QXD-8]MDQ7876575.1 GNAT family N-acetyltransferase [Microbacterium sp. QXD-8]